MIYFEFVCKGWDPPVKNVVLIGMPGSGKSTVGVLLAKALGYGFLDVDLVIQQREGALLQEILDARGVEAFLDAEEEAVCSVSCTHHVIAPGGSAICREKAALHLKSLGPRSPLRQICRPGHRLRRRPDPGPDRPKGEGASGGLPPPPLTAPQPAGTAAGRAEKHLRPNA